MIGRSLPEWIGKSPDQKPPTRVRARVFLLKEGRCHKCTRRIQTGEKWTLEHVQALVNGGENRESNMDLTCCNCLPQKNAEDVAEKSYVARVRNRHLGLKGKSRFAGARTSKFKKKIDGTVVLR